MKKNLLSMFALAMAMPMAAQTNFRPIDFNQALVDAKKEGKMVFVDFYTDWCGPCKQMARETFPQKKVGDYMNNAFVCIKLNAEKEGKALADKYEVNAYPTFIITDTQGKVLGDVKGSMDGDTFIEKVKNALDPDMSPARIKERYESGERTPELVNAYALQVLQSNKETEGMAIVNEYYNSLTRADRLKAENAFLFTRYTIDISDEKGQFMVKNRDNFDVEVRDEVNSQIAQLYRSKVMTYFSGYNLAPERYKEADYKKLKADILALGLNKDDVYGPLFRLIDARLCNDDNTFLDMCVAEYQQLADRDKALLMANMNRLITSTDKGILKKMSAFIRENLCDMTPSCISLAARTLTTIESALAQ